MKTPVQTSQIRQLDRLLAEIKDNKRSIPSHGWIRAVRRAFNISAQKLACKLGISQQSIAQRERNELTGGITLANLQSCAEAMGCELVYGFVPKNGSFENQAFLQAESSGLSLDSPHAWVTETMGRHQEGLKVQAKSIEEIQAYEEQAVLEAYHWAQKPSVLRSLKPLEEGTWKALHKKIYGNIWTNAGKYKRMSTDKRKGSDIYREIRHCALDLKQLKEKKQPAALIALHAHAELIRIQPFEVGSGPLARMVADIVCMQHGRAPFSWGVQHASDNAKRNTLYDEGLRDATSGNYEKLLAFAQS